MSKKQPTILIFTIFVLLIAAVMSPGSAVSISYYNAGSSDYVDSDSSMDFFAYVEVTPDGIISEYSERFTISQLSSFSKYEVDTLIDWTISVFKSEDYEDFTIDGVNNADNAVITLKNKRPISISKDSSLTADMRFTPFSYDDTITFKDFGVSSFSSAADEPSTYCCIGGKFIQIKHSADDYYESSTYTLKMPGKILESNADEVKGDTAVWFLRNGGDERWATSKTSGFPFGWLAVFVVICAVIGLFLWRRS